MLRRLRHLFRRARLDREMSEELDHHLSLQIEQNRAAGMTPDEARHAALRSFGHLEGVKEQVRDQRGFVWLRDLPQDLRYGLRQLLKAPGFALVAILTLAIGIGSTTAIFSIVNGVVLQPLPYGEADRLVALRETSPNAGDLFASSRYATRLSYAAWKEQATVFESTGAASYWQCIMTGAGEPARYYGWRVSSGFFGTLGVQPIRGRSFLPEEFTAGKGQVAIVSHRLWQSQFDGRDDVVGRSVQINDQPYTIVGVLPPQFLPETITDPAVFSPDPSVLGPGNLSEGLVETVGRLKPGVTLPQANSELNLISARVAREHPDLKKGWGARAMWLLDSKVGEIRSFLFILLGAVGFLLLIACFNVANLLLARAGARAKEISIRASLGAGRGRIIRQLLSESLLLAVVGALLGVLLAYGGLHVLMSHAPLSLPRTQEVSIDGVVLLFSCGLAIATGVGFGLVPAFNATRGNLAEAMNSAARSSTEGPGNQRLRHILVVLEVSLALVLLVLAVLLMHSFARLKQVPLGYETGQSFVSRIFLPESRYRGPQEWQKFVDAAVDHLSAVPGVEHVVFSNRFPAYGLSERIVIVGSRPERDPQTLPRSSYYITTPGYFGALHIPMVRGRLFDAHDQRDSEPVALISEGFAAKYFAGVDPVGQSITILGPKDVSRRIVGVVGTVQDFGPLTDRPFQIYVPLAQDPIRSPHLMVGVNRGFAGLESALRQAMNRVDPDMPLAFNGIDLEGFLNETIAPQRYALFIFSVFSGVALLLSAMGIYSVVAYSVTKRTHEIGLRMALGAQAADILRLIFSQNGRMVGLGVVIGLAGSLAATRLLGTLLFHVSAHDPLALAGASLTLALVALFACWFPARRATKVDPMIALRTE